MLWSGSRKLHPALNQSHRTVRLVCDGVVVSDHHYSEMLFLVQGSQQVHDFFTRGGIEITGRFVGQQHRGLAIRARAIAARCISPPKVPGFVSQPVRKPHHGQ